MKEKTNTEVENVMDNQKSEGNITVHVPHDLEIKNGTDSSGAVVGKGWTMQRKYPKIGRNDPCSCGSGKKAKKCCYVPYGQAIAKN